MSIVFAVSATKSLESSNSRPSCSRRSLPPRAGPHWVRPHRADHCHSGQADLQLSREVRSFNPQAVQSAMEIGDPAADPPVGIRPLHIGETSLHSSTPAIISMIRVDQVKHHQGKASPPVGSGCQGSLQILEVKTM